MTLPLQLISPFKVDHQGLLYQKDDDDQGGQDVSTRIGMKDSGVLSVSESVLRSKACCSITRKIHKREEWDERRAFGYHHDIYDIVQTQAASPMRGDRSQD
jgi:hypothetical protein